MNQAWEGPQSKNSETTVLLQRSTYRERSPPAEVHVQRSPLYTPPSCLSTVNKGPESHKNLKRFNIKRSSSKFFISVIPHILGLPPNEWVREHLELVQWVEINMDLLKQTILLEILHVMTCWITDVIPVCQNILWSCCHLSISFHLFLISGCFYRRKQRVFVHFYYFRRVQRSAEESTYLAHGLIFRARPRLIQKPAPPVANQNLTDTWNEIKSETSADSGRVLKLWLYSTSVFWLNIVKPGFRLTSCSDPSLVSVWTSLIILNVLNW